LRIGHNVWDTEAGKNNERTEFCFHEFFLLIDGLWVGTASSRMVEG
jgi:hypothetical protein